MPNLSVRSCLVVLIYFLCLHYGYTQHCNGGADCISLEACGELYRQLQQGNSPQLTSLLRRLHCGFGEFNQPKVCCPPEYLSTRINNEDSSAVVNNFRPNVANNGANNRRPVDSQSLLPTEKVCGIQNNERIFGGTETEIDEHPWMALLRYDKPRGSGFYCGGVLISTKYVLTAAHCVKGQDLPPSWRLSQVRLGEWNISSLIDCIQNDCNQKPVDVPIEEVIAHEGYNPADSNQHNDIALIRLSRDVEINDFVRPICLPLNNGLRLNDFNGYTMEVAGWGKTESRSESDVKLKVKVPIVNRNECSSVYKRADRVIGAKQLCAGGISGQDSCRGDSGGALMGWTPTSLNWVVAGIVSYGPSPCGTPGWPGVYTRVGSYVDWILSKIYP